MNAPRARATYIRFSDKTKDNHITSLHDVNHNLTANNEIRTEGDHSVDSHGDQAAGAIQKLNENPSGLFRVHSALSSKDTVPRLPTPPPQGPKGLNQRQRVPFIGHLPTQSTQNTPVETGESSHVSNARSSDDPRVSPSVASLLQ